MSSSSHYSVDEVSSQSPRDNQSSWLFLNSSKRRKESKGSSYANDEGSYLISNVESLHKSLLDPKPRATTPSSRKFLSVLIATSALVFMITMALHPCPIIAAFSSIHRFQDPDPATEIDSYPEQEARFKDRTFTIALLGDSLINKPFQMFQLSEKIQAHLPGYKLNIVNCGSNGAQIASIRKDLLPTCVTPAAADAVLIFWDSDISDVNEDILSASAKYALRETYRTNLLGTLDTIKKSGAYVALSGPGVLGEGHRFFAPKVDRFRNKEVMLDWYTDLNKVTAASLNVPYIDVRQAFLDSIPSYQLCYSLCVTYDGEHENERGTVIVAKLFAKSLSIWLSTFLDETSEVE